MADINVTASANIKDVTYAAGDQLIIYSSTLLPIVLTIDAQDAGDVAKVEGATRPQAYNVRNNATLLIKNTSTTVPLIVRTNTTSNTSSLLAISPSGLIKFEGAFISIGIGTGALGQTIDLNSFLSSTGLRIDIPAIVEVETAAGSGVYIPFYNIRGNRLNANGVTYPVYYTFASFADTPEMGNVFEYNESTGVIYFATASGAGYPPPNGANIRYPNIHFTGPTVPTASNTRPGVFGTNANYGSYDFNTCAFSERLCGNIGSTNMNVHDFKVRKFFSCLASRFDLSHGTIDIDGYYRGPDLINSQFSGMTFANCAGPVSIKDVMSVGFSSPQDAICISEAQPTALDNLWAVSIERTNGWSLGGLRLNNVTLPDDAPLVTGAFRCNGSHFELQNCTNVVVSSLEQSDQTRPVGSTSNAIRGMRLSNCRNVIVKTVRLTNGGAPTSGALIENSITNANTSIHDVDYNGHNPSGGARFMGRVVYGNIGERCWYANINTPGVVNNVIDAFSYTKAKGRLCNIRTNYAITQQAGNQPGYMLEMCSTPSWRAQIISGLDILHEGLQVTSADNTVGALCLYYGAEKALMDTYTFAGTPVDGTDYVFSGDGRLGLPVSGVSITWRSLFPIRGITAIPSGASLYGWHTSYGVTSFPAGITVEFRLANAGSGVWGSTYAFTAANFKTAFEALTGYDSNVGFDVESFATTTTNDTGRRLGFMSLIDITVDPTFNSAIVGYIEVGHSGLETGASVAVLDNATPSAPVQKGYIPSSTDVAVFEYPYAFDGLADPIKIVSRKAGYLEAVSEVSVFQAGVSVPVKLVAAQTTTDADVSGIAITGSTESIAVSAGITLAQLYQKSQWWAHQEASMVYAIPVIAPETGKYTSAFDVSVADGYVLNGAGSLSMGSNLLSTEFASGVNYTYTGGTWSQLTTVPTFSGGQVNLGAAGTFVFGVGSDTILSMTPAAASDYNMGGLTVSGTLDLRNTTAHAINVAIPVGVSAITTNNTGGTITPITPPVTVTVTVKDAVTGTAIENARVLLELVSDGTDVLTGLTNASGVATTSYAYTADAAVIGTARRATAAYGTLYKPGTISGTVTASGFDVTVLLNSDE